MSGTEKSDPAIVAAKPANGQADASPELAERRAGAKGNAGAAHMVRAPARDAVVSRLNRVREVARTREGERFTTLMTYLDVEMLRFAYGELKRDAAPGVDGVTWWEYGEGLDDRLADLKDRLHRGSYRAQPSRRHFIPKSDGRLRPLGIAALEDKVVQRAVVEILNAIFEEDFLDCSYGFRPPAFAGAGSRGQHDALDAVAVGISHGKVNWILDADIRAFFDSIDHGWMMRFVEHRIGPRSGPMQRPAVSAPGDRRILRLIHKWLVVGVMDETGERQPATVGSPQGAVISPPAFASLRRGMRLLANLYLHHVYDLWAKQWSRRHATGEMRCKTACKTFQIPGVNSVQ